MVISTPPQLSNGLRLILIVISLFLLQVNVPVPDTESIWVSADFVLPAQEPVKVWQPAKLLFASLKEEITTLKADFASNENTSRSFRIVKIESRRRDSSSSGAQWPVKGSISSAFGMRRHPVTKRNSFHNGIDIRARQGTSIICPADGVVVCAGHAGLLGRLVKVRTTNGKTLYFGHMHRIKCRKGQRIKHGTIIGTVGSSGRATGPHLHFSVVASGKYLNPLKYLSAD